MRNGGKILVDQLRLRGTNSVFCVPGESYLDILNALYDVPEEIKIYNARHEAGAANMAEAYGKLTGQPGVALVTRGPGACHASVGVHIAYQDSTPMILIVGQVSQDNKDREAFQEIDYKLMFSGIAKWCAQIDCINRIPEYVNRAFNTALSGRKGPVVLAVPENILAQEADTLDYVVSKHTQSAPPKNIIPSLELLFEDCNKPLILLGGSGWTTCASGQLQAFALEHDIPVTTSFRRQDLVDNKSRIYCGSFGTSVSPTLLKRLKEADLLIVLGARMGEMTTQGYQVIRPGNLNQKLVHIHPDANEIGKVYAPTLGINSSVTNIAELLAEININKPKRWIAWCKSLRSEHLFDINPPGYEGNLDLGKIFSDLDKELPENAIVTLDAGNHTGWPQRFLNFSPRRRQVGSTCGTMGYSIPAAVAASLLYKDRLVVGLVGDGGFMMSGMELTTAVQYATPLIILVFNNNSYGTIRMHQEMKYPGRVVATSLVNPNFEAFGIALGLHSETISRTEDFMPAFRRCLQLKKPCLLALQIDANQLTSRLFLNEISE